MHIHILGICGTFMGGLALLARAAGLRVSGSDAGVYPPMSEQLEAADIELREGYEPAHLQPHPDLVVIGNALSRGNPAVEYVLDQGLDYVSGPEWLYRQVLRQRWVLAVAGTHGKTTTASLLAWVLEHAGLQPGFLIGGVPANFGVSARLGAGAFFVVEADEYDTAFFDKRAKFVHYRPRTLVLNNLEFDHADIYPDLAAIRRQFHHLLRIVPGSGKLLLNAMDGELAELLQMGVWTPAERFGLEHGDWRIEASTADGREARIVDPDGRRHELRWGQIGAHNLLNALAALAASRHAGVPTALAIEALAQFSGVRRRMEIRGVVAGVTVYDDFAHHPTAISASLSALRARVGDARILAVVEPRSNTMRMGVHRRQLSPALAAADQRWLLQTPGLDWRWADLDLPPATEVAASIDDLLPRLLAAIRPGDHVLIMSNGAIGGLHRRLLEALGSAAVVGDRL